MKSKITVNYLAVPVKIHFINILVSTWPFGQVSVCRSGTCVFYTWTPQKKHSIPTSQMCTKDQGGQSLKLTAELVIHHCKSWAGSEKAFLHCQRYRHRMGHMQMTKACSSSTVNNNSVSVVVLGMIMGRSGMGVYVHRPSRWVMNLPWNSMMFSCCCL